MPKRIQKSSTIFESHLRLMSSRLLPIENAFYCARHQTQTSNPPYSSKCLCRRPCSRHKPPFPFSFVRALGVHDCTFIHRSIGQISLVFSMRINLLSRLVFLDIHLFLFCLDSLTLCKFCSIKGCSKDMS